MGEILLNFLSGLTDNPKLITLLVSMFPLIELKGAIPIGTGLGLSLIESSLLSYLGSTLVVIPVYFLLIPIFNLLKKIKFIKRLIQKIEAVFDKKAQDLAKKSNGAPEDKVMNILTVSLLVFVAVPFPVTGVWTGTAIAVFLSIPFKKAFPAIAVGNFIAGVIITIITFFFKDYVDTVITVLLIIAIIMLVILIVKIALSKPKED